MVRSNREQNRNGEMENQRNEYFLCLLKNQTRTQQPKLVELKIKLRNNYPFVNYSKEMENESLKPIFHLINYDGAN